MAVSSSDETTALWNLESRKKIALLDSRRTIIARLAHSPDGKLLVGAGEKEIQIWNVETQKPVSHWNGHESVVASVGFTPDGQQIVSSGYDGVIKFWETKTWTEVGAFHLGRDKAVTLAVAPDGKCLAAGLWSGDVVFFNISRKARMMHLDRDLLKSSVGFWGHNLPVTTVAFRADGKMFASGGLDATVKMWINLPEFK